eukprot:UN01684
MIVSSTSYSVAFGIERVSSGFTGLLKSVLIDFLVCWVYSYRRSRGLFANHYLRIVRLHAVEQKCEWLYSFDIHCNGYVPYFFISHVGVFFLTPIILHETTITLLISNTLYILACCIYFYITFQGYNALPFLHHTESFLYPIILMLLLYVVSLLSRFHIVHFYD